MNNLEKTLFNFKNKKIVVIGDIMLDKYFEGSVSRINPEAPVPIVSLKKEFYELGGAANVASNIASLGGGVFLFGFVGKDESANKLRELLKKKKINFFLEENKTTTEKTRILGEGQQLVRFDKEETSEKNFSERVKRVLLEKAESSSVILLSDYAKGVITLDLMELLNPYKNKMIIDPKPKNQHLYKEVFLITPNEKESLEMSSCSDVEMAGNFLKKELNSNVLIKRGGKGMSLFSKDNSNIPTYAKEVYDVVGAGDTVTSAIALAIASGASIEESAIIANHAAGIAVEKKGTYSVGFKELMERINSEEKKIIELGRLKENVLDYKRKGKKIVWTNGCFDLLHIGHTRYLKEAKKLGDILIVGINSDESVRKLKGNGRPVQSALERAEILSSLEFVDGLLIFPELTVERYLSELQPDIYVKGGDYDIDTINEEEKKIVKEYGGKIEFVSFISGKSSSNLIEKVSKTTHQ